ncbi:MAG TPA: hypothetical protein VKZ98_10645 [Aquaticitalea sp.]|nr:hypothetical protein [Aquaticitalea sp.]
MRHYIIFVFLGFFVVDLDAQSTNLQVAAQTFSIHPKVGSPASHSRSGNMIEEVYGDLKSTIILFRDGDNTFCLFTSTLGIARGSIHDFCVKEISNRLNIPIEAISLNSSHNHTIPIVDIRDVQMPDKTSPQYLSWELGREFRNGFINALENLEAQLKDVTVEWGVAEENRITYNRKGYRLDGQSYFIREEDRLEIEGEGYHGVIDPDAAVVLFKDMTGKPVTAISFFTGHPVAAYNPEKMISFGQFPQIGSDMLSDHLGGIPVAFVQGCGGNINSKHMLTGTIDQAMDLGKKLGESFIVASQRLKPSKRTGLEWSREIVNIPLDELPSLESLEKDLVTIDDFISRGKNGDENTMECVGLNFPKELTPPYRARLIELVRPWYVWAIEQHQSHNWRNLPEFLPISIVVARFGDVGFVGMPYEVFVETGLKIKKYADLPYVLTCGYTDGSYGYIPNASGVNDMEYMSSNYRYRGSYGVFPDWKGKKDDVPNEIYSAYEFTPPYKAPAGDACADAAILKLAEFAR